MVICRQPLPHGTSVAQKSARETVVTFTSRKTQSGLYEFSPKMHSKNCCIALAQLGKNASGVIKLAPLATSISCPGRRTGKVVCLCKHGKKAADGSHLACAFTKSTAGCYHVCKCTKNSPAGECALHSPATGRALPNSPTRVRGNFSTPGGLGPAGHGKNSATPYSG
ncbi:hypothetical protein Ndes2437A_g04587 [Nannochloris sp. 'desiccata']